MQRRYDLDWLRVIAFGLLMLFHTGMMFSTWDWHVKNLETSAALDQVMRFVHQWRMPLLFFISGSAVWFALERYSTWKYVLERHKRLLLPLVFGMLVVIPPQVYYERRYHFMQYASFWDFYPTIFTTGAYPEGNLSWHHLWYIPYIFTYSMLLLPVCLWLRSAAGRRLLERALTWLERPWLLFLIFLPSALAEVLLRPFWGGDANNLLSDWANFTHKLTIFAAGFILASGTRVYDTIAKYRRWFLAAAIPAFAALQAIWLSSWHAGRWGMAAYWTLHNFNIWMWLLTVLGYGRRYLSFNHGFLRYANEAVYPFYILHQTIIIILAYYLVYINWSIPVKFLVLVGGTFFITWALYAFAIRRWNLLRVPFGLKWRGATSVDARSSTLRAVAVKLSSFRALIGMACLGLALFAGCSSRSGRLLVKQIEARSLESNRFGVSRIQPLAVYLPPSYGTSDRRFPVLYLLPNFNNCLWHYTGGTYQGFHLREAMDRLIRQGKVREMIVVIPNAVHFLGGSWYQNSTLTGNWEDFVVNDVVQYVDGHFRTVASAKARGLAGHGMGGTGALELALKHPDRFGCVYALSPAIFDARGLGDAGFLAEPLRRHWQANMQSLERLDDAARRQSFRDYFQTRVNSPAGERFGEALAVSYAAAVAPDLSLPYPHIAFPAPGPADPATAALVQRYEDGLGGWTNKLARYLAQGRRLQSITLEYTAADQYEWLRRGAEHVHRLMGSLGIPSDLEVHQGTHESTLGQRLETAMLPAISRALHTEP